MISAKICWPAVRRGNLDLGCSTILPNHTASSANLSPSRTRQKVELPKSKSTQAKSARRWTSSLYIYFGTHPLRDARTRSRRWPWGSLAWAGSPWSRSCGWRRRYPSRRPSSPRPEKTITLSIYSKNMYFKCGILRHQKRLSHWIINAFHIFSFHHISEGPYHNVYGTNPTISSRICYD